MIAKQVSKSYSFYEVLENWQGANNLRQKGATRLKYDNIICKHIVPELGEYEINQLNSKVINQFLFNKSKSGRLDCKGGLSNSYVREIAFIVISAMQFAHNEGMCNITNVNINKPSIIKKDLTILDIESQKQLEKYILNNLDEYGLGILISLYTGMRIGEICALKWDNVDLKNKIISVRNTISRVKSEQSSNKKTELIVDSPKTRSSIRDIPISSNLYDMILNFKSQNNQMFVISKNDSFINPRTYEYRFHKIIEKSGIEQFNYHTLRHTFATRCVEAGIDIKTLSEILGHSNVSITLNTYVHSSLDQKRKQLEKLVNFCE